MRTSSVGMYSTLSRSLVAAQARVIANSNQMATGIKVNYASDNPTDASQLMRLDTELHANETFRRSNVDASAWVAVTDRALNDANSILQRANELALSSLNGSLSLQQRTAIGDEITQLKSQLATSANASYLGQAVFAGHSTAAISSAFTFSGVVGPVNRQLELNTTIDVGSDGQEIFGFNLAPGKDAFSVLTALATAVTNPVFSTAAVTAAQTDLSVNRESVINAMSDVGTRTQTIEAIGARLVTADQETQKARIAIGDIDLAKAALEMAAAKTAYTAALQAAAQAQMPTLASFL